MDNLTTKKFKYIISFPHIGNYYVPIYNWLSNIIDKNNYEKGINCIIIVRKGLLEKNYQEKEKILLEAFHKLNIIKEKNNEKK